MKLLKHPLHWHVAGWMNWLNDHLCYSDPEAQIGWKDHVRWWLEDVLCRILVWSYRGSADEISDGIQWAQEGVDPKYLSPLQREIASRLPEWTDTDH